MKTLGMDVLFEWTGASNEPLVAMGTRAGDRDRLQVAEEELYAAIEQLRGAGARILSVSQVKATLEEFFMNLVEADRAQGAAGGGGGERGGPGGGGLKRFLERGAGRGVLTLGFFRL